MKYAVGDDSHAESKPAPLAAALGQADANARLTGAGAQSRRKNASLSRAAGG